VREFRQKAHHANAHRRRNQASQFHALAFLSYGDSFLFAWIVVAYVAVFSSAYRGLA
jgi:hypothetical protein